MKTFTPLKSPKLFIVMLAAIVMGFISAKFLFSGSVLNVLPWGILTCAIILLASSKREAMKLGGVFGFVVSFSFLFFDNTDSKSFSNLIVLVPLAAGVALFGLLCGILISWLAWKLRVLIIKQR